MAGTALMCANHLRDGAAWECKPCAKWLCGQCVKVFPDGRTASCVKCGALAVPLGQASSAVRGPVSNAARDLTVDEPLLERILMSLAYLIKPSVLWTVAGISVFLWFAEFAGYAGFFGFGARWLIFGLEAGLYFHIVFTTANGAEDLEAPDFSDMYESMVMPAVRYMATFLILLAAVLWAGSRLIDFVLDPKKGFEFGGPLILVVIWLLLWPLLTAIAAIGQSIRLMYDPRIWVDTIRKLGVDYLVGAGAFYAVLALEVIGLRTAMYLFEQQVDIAFVSAYIAQFVLFLPKVLRARIIGELCKPYI